MIRSRSLPPGWYPDTDEGVRAQCTRWEEGLPPVSRRFVGAVVPHAGWAFSGRIAYRVLRALARDVETVVVAGGHLRPTDFVHLASEDRYETPLGALDADLELADYLTSRVETVDDRRPDNTVEVQLPLIHALFPGTRALYLRCPPSGLASDVGAAVAEFAARHGRTTCVVGSTDLTHYGPAYGFSPVGTGEKAVEWVKNTNDRAVVDAMVRMDEHETIRLALENQAACSSGAAAAAIAHARLLGCEEGTLVEYGQSYDVRPDASFVGYAGVGFESPAEARA